MKVFPYSAGRAALAAQRAKKRAVPVKVVSKGKRSNPYPVTKIFRTKRTYSNQINLVSSGVSQFSAIGIALSSFPGYSADLTQLFDKYRIRSITVRFIPMQRDQITSLNSVGQLATIIDHDDNNAPASYDEMRQYPSYRTKSLTDYHSVTFKPCVANAVYSGSSFTGYGSMKDAWIDMASPSVVHYGLKVGVQNCMLPTNSLLYDIEITAVLEFSDVR